MTFTIRSLVLLFPILLMVGCSYLTPTSALQSHNKQYLKATSVPPLTIPPGIASSQFHNYYPVSYTQYPESAKDVSLIPPGL